MHFLYSRTRYQVMFMKNGWKEESYNDNKNEYYV
jgi:hypothetical protein